jgi:uncharacterized protein YgiB involved in biofilm formation
MGNKQQLNSEGIPIDNEHLNTALSKNNWTFHHVIGRGGFGKVSFKKSC